MSNVKVIFLDIDGVLITAHTCRQGFGIVDPSCVIRLNRLTDETGAKIVVSSCWRIGKEVIELRERLRNWGVTGQVIDRTPYFPSAKRGIEIQAWLDERQKHRGDVESFVIIDDDSDMEHLLPRLVKTNFYTGLLDSHVVDSIAAMESNQDISDPEAEKEKKA